MNLHKAHGWSMGMPIGLQQWQRITSEVANKISDDIKPAPAGPHLKTKDKSESKYFQSKNYKPPLREMGERVLTSATLKICVVCKMKIEGNRTQALYMVQLLPLGCEWITHCTTDTETEQLTKCMACLLLKWEITDKKEDWAYIKRTERSQVNDLMLHLKLLENPTDAEGKK
jgi:hypothetical protein